MKTKLQLVLAQLSYDESLLLWRLLAQHVEDERCNDEVEDPESTPEFKLTEKLLERMEAALVV